MQIESPVPAREPLHRLFYALRPPPGAAAAIEEDTVWLGPWRRVRRDMLHVTLNILDDWPVQPRHLIEAMLRIGGRDRGGAVPGRVRSVERECAIGGAAAERAGRGALRFPAIAGGAAGASGDRDADRGTVQPACLDRASRAARFRDAGRCGELAGRGVFADRESGRVDRASGAWAVAAWSQPSC